MHVLEFLLTPRNDTSLVLLPDLILPYFMCVPQGSLFAFPYFSAFLFKTYLESQLQPWILCWKSECMYSSHLLSNFWLLTSDNLKHTCIWMFYSQLAVLKSCSFLWPVFSIICSHREHSCNVCYVLDSVDAKVFCILGCSVLRMKNTCKWVLKIQTHKRFWSYKTATLRGAVRIGVHIPSWFWKGHF